MYNIIFTISFCVLLLLFIGIGLLRSKRYVWYYSVSRLSAAVVSAVVSFFISGALIKLVTKLVYDLVIDKIPASIGGILKDISVTPELLSTVLIFILAPLLFIIFYFILKAILVFIAKNICISVGKKKAAESPKAEAAVAETAKDETTVAETVNAEVAVTEAETVMDNAVEPPVAAEAVDPVDALVTDEVNENLTASEAEKADKTDKTKKKNKKEKAPKRIKRISYVKTPKANAAGMICGAVCGLTLFVVIMIPFTGVAAIADDVMGLVSTVLDQEVILTVDEVTDAAANNPVSKVVRVAGGTIIYDGLTTGKISGHKVTLTDEVHLVTTAGHAVITTINNNVSREEAAASIREISAAFSDSDLVPAIAPEVLAAANESWEKGEDFHGIKKISVNGKAKPIVDQFVDILIASDYDTLKKDADTIVEIVAVVVEQDGINVVLKDPAGIAEHEEITAPVIYELLENEHLSPMMPTIADLGMEYIGGKFKINTDRDGIYSEFISEAAGQVSAVIATGFTDPTEHMIKIYSDLFDDYGLSVTDESKKAIAIKTIETFPEGAVSVEAMTEFLANQELDFSNGSKVRIDSADALATNSLLVFTEDIKFDLSNVTDNAYESKALAKAIRELIMFNDILKAGGFANAGTIQKLGPLLDALALTNIMSDEDTGNFLMGILQSEAVHDKIGFSLLGATDVARSIYGKSSSQGYSPLLKSLCDTVEVVKLTTSETSTKEEVNAKVETLLQELTPESAEVLQTLTSPEVIVSQGVPEQSAEPVSNLVSNMFGNLASAKDNGMSEEEYKKEAAAASNLLNMALASTSAGKNIFAEVPTKNEGDTEPDQDPDEGQDPDSGTEQEPDTDTGTETPAGNAMTAADYIDSVMNSAVISQTIIEAAYTEESGEEPVIDPLNMGKTLTENEQVQVLESLNQHWANASDDDKSNTDYFKTYAAIGAMVNFPITIGPDGTIIANTAA